MHPRNTFESFVVGQSNQLAHAAAQVVAQVPGQPCCPLFIHGATGLGKTHLMNAIEHGVPQRDPKIKVVHLSAEFLSNAYILAKQVNALTKFVQRYRGLDVLLLDDIQFFSSEERSPEGFGPALKVLLDSQRQIVLTSDRPAAEVVQPEASLLSHIQSSHSAEIRAPDFETRVAILNVKATALKVSLPTSVIEFIAQQITKNIRQLEGALIKVSSHVALTGKQLDLATAESLLRDMLMNVHSDTCTARKTK